MSMPALQFLWMASAGLAVFFSLVLAGAALRQGMAGRRFRRRLERVARQARHDSVVPAAGNAEPPLVQASPTPRLDRLIRGMLPGEKQLRLRLERTGRALSPGRYLLWCLGVAVVTLPLTGLGLRLGPAPSILLALLAGTGLPHFAVTVMARRRVAEFLQLLPDAIDLIVRALRAGLPIAEAVSTVGREIGDPVGAEFRRIENAMKLGRALEAELWEVARRIDVAEFRFFAVSVAVQRQTGGNLGETLANLGDILRRRRAMRRKIMAISSEARTSAMILGFLPFVVGLLIFATTPSYLMPLFTSPGGWLLCGIGVVMLLTGGFIMYRLIRFEI